MHSKDCGTLYRKHLEDCGSEAGNSYGHAHLLFSARSCFLQQDTKYSHISPILPLCVTVLWNWTAVFFLSTEKYDLMVKEGEIVCLGRETLSQVDLQILFFIRSDFYSLICYHSNMLLIATNAIKLHLTTETHPSNGGSGWNHSNISLQFKNNVRLIITRDVWTSRRLFKSVFEFASTPVISGDKGWRLIVFIVAVVKIMKDETSYMTTRAACCHRLAQKNPNIKIRLNSETEIISEQLKFNILNGISHHLSTFLFSFLLEGKYEANLISSVVNSSSRNHKLKIKVFL